MANMSFQGIFDIAYFDRLSYMPSHMSLVGDLLSPRDTIGSTSREQSTLGETIYGSGDTSPLSLVGLSACNSPSWFDFINQSRPSSPKP